MLPERAFGRSLTSIMFFRLFYADPDRDSTGPRSHMPRWSTAELAEFRRQFRQRLVKIGNESIVGDLEDRRLFVLVDGHDDFRILHPGEMLDRAGNPGSDVELGRHNLAGLADLPVVGRITGIDRRARGADRRAELVGDRLDIFGEILPALHGPSAGNDDLR